MAHSLCSLHIATNEGVDIILRSRWMDAVMGVLEIAILDILINPIVLIMGDPVDLEILKPALLQEGFKLIFGALNAVSGDQFCHEMYGCIRIPH